MRKEIYTREPLAKKMENTHTRIISNFKMKLEALFEIFFRKMFMYKKIFVFKTPASKVTPKMVNRAKVEVRIAQSDDIPKLEKFERFRGGKAEQRFKAGHLCFIAEKNGDIVNYTWVSFNETYVAGLERTIRIGSDYAYRYDGYTVPEYRGMGILPTVLTKAAEYLFQNEIKEIYDVVASNNFPSLRSHQKIGSMKMGEVTVIRLFNSRRYKLKGETLTDYIRLKEMFSI